MKLGKSYKLWFLLGIFFIVGLLWTSVLRSQNSSKLEKAFRCGTDNIQEGKDCSQDQIRAALRQEGIDKAFGVLAQMYDAQKMAGDTCHDLTHQIGQEAYRLFKSKKSFAVTAKTAYCSYGFYHGFMEALVTQGADMNVAREFCAYVDKQLSRVTPDAAFQCYHGIGHGTVNSHDQSTWGDEQKLIDPALALCEQVSDTTERLSRCATGVFNGIAIFYNTGEYKLTIDPTDPLRICRNQKEQYKDPCYISLNVTLLTLTNGDFVQAAQFVERIPQQLYAQHAILNLAAPVGTRNAGLSDHKNMISTCRSLQPRLRLACIQGYAYGFLEHGEPEREYEKPLEFCKSEILAKDEQTACFEYIFYYLGMWYSQDKAAYICSTLAQEYKETCVAKVVEAGKNSSL